jgi:hypothetical protein
MFPAVMFSITMLFATADAPGKWRIRATNVLTGNSASKDLELAVGTR